MTAELAAIRRCLERAIPVLGVCLGSQMLAHAAGAQVFRGALPEIGWYPIRLTESGRMDPLLLGLPDEFDAFHWHGDTFTLPPGAKLLAGSAWYPHQVFRVGSNAYGFQCHLEVTEPMVRAWSRVYAKELTPQGGPIHPERIETDLAARIQSLRAIAEKVFTRFAALL
jgi:GMP synthase-like glutamine amidotransferase